MDRRFPCLKDAFTQPEVTICENDIRRQAKEVNQSSQDPSERNPRLVQHQGAGHQPSAPKPINSAEDTKLVTEAVGIEGVVKDHTLPSTEDHLHVPLVLYPYQILQHPRFLTDILSVCLSSNSKLLQERLCLPHYLSCEHWKPILNVSLCPRDWDATLLCSPAQEVMDLKWQPKSLQVCCQGLELLWDHMVHLKWKACLYSLREWMVMVQLGSYHN